MNENFTLVEETNIEQIDCVMQVYKHKKTGARHIHMLSNDKNFPENGFSVNINTIPENDKGIAHILEHFICVGGSQKYPIKSGLFKIMDKTVSKFVNAQTGNDTTKYLFASDNKQDYINNMDFYLDSIFNSTMEKDTFLQEGWRYNIDSNGKLKFDGVVLNEMKGYENNEVMNNLHRIKKAFYKGTVYENNSGGDSESITDLSFEELKAFYDKFYHPSNCVFYTFSHLPVEQIQNKIQEAIAKFEPLKIELDPKTYYIHDLDTSDYYTEHFSASEDNANEQSMYFMFKGFLAIETENIIKAKIAEMLFLNPNSEFIKYIEENSLNLGQNLTGYLSFFDQNAFLINLVNVHANHVQEIKDKTLSAIEDFKHQNWSKEFLLSILEQIELEEKEQKANGSSYSLSILRDIDKYFKYQDMTPATAYNNKNIFANIRKEIEDGVFVKNICEKLFDKNNFKLMVSSPNQTLNKEKQMREEQKLKTAQDKLTQEDIAHILSENDKLKLQQAKPVLDSDLPSLTKEDIEVEDFKWIVSPSYQKDNATLYKYPKEVSYVNFKLETPVKSKNPYDSLVASAYSNLINGLFAFNNMNLEESFEKLMIDCPDFAVGEQETCKYNFDKNNLTVDKKEFVNLSISAKSLAKNTDKMVSTMTMAFLNADFSMSQEKLKTFLMSKKQELLNTNTIAEALAGKLKNTTDSKAKNDMQEVVSAQNVKQVSNLLDLCIEDKQAFDKLLQDVSNYHKKVLETNSKDSIVVKALVPEDKFNVVLNAFEGFKASFKNEPKHTSYNKYLENYEMENRPFNKAFVSHLQGNQCFEIRDTKDLSVKERAALDVASKLLKPYLYKLLREEKGAYTFGSARQSNNFVIYTMKDPNNVETFENMQTCIQRFSKDLQDNKISQKDIDKVLIKMTSRENIPDLYSKYVFSDKINGENSKDYRVTQQELLTKVTIEDIANVWNKAVLNNNKISRIVSSPEQFTQKLQEAGFEVENVNDIMSKKEMNLLKHKK